MSPNKPSSGRDRDRTVLVCVLKNKRDLDLLLWENWYRIPLLNLPKRGFEYLAFYQPAAFGSQGKRINYYAKAGKVEKLTRIKLLPRERNHPGASDDYARIRISRIRKLKKPIKNNSPRRVVFGFTNLGRLLRARNILQLYGVAETEALIGRELRSVGIRAKAQYRISFGKKRYVLDFAVFCRNGRIAIECDNWKAHRGKLQARKDETKNQSLENGGWTVVRLKEKEIVENAQKCMVHIGRIMDRLGGQAVVE
ncbi:MAG: DUF559 domain-containing protein [Candidatus Liptonbacteria bacterium]